MKVKELLRKLGDSYPESADMNVDQLIAELLQDQVTIKNVSYGEKHSPIVSVPPWSSGLPGFEFILKNGGTTIKPVLYGPKLRKFLL